MLEQLVHMEVKNPDFCLVVYDYINFCWSSIIHVQGTNTEPRLQCQKEVAGHVTVMN